MSASAAFLTRLARIASESGCAETCTTRVTTLVAAYETVLYIGLGIAGAQRLTARTKEIAKEALEALRRELLKSEINASPAAAAVFAAARDRIDMARRALALRLTVEDAGAPASIGRNDDRQRLAVTRSREAIGESSGLLRTS
jgi:gamma-glutamylcysteine synthetase